MNLTDKLRKTAERECINGGFNYSGLSLDKFSRKPHFEMKTSLKTGEIKISYNPEYEQMHPDETQIVVKDGTRHEINHHGYRGFKGCPRNVKNHAKLIFEPISKVLMPAYFHEDCHYISNALEDTILHSDLSTEFSLDGISGFFDDVGSVSKFSPFYEAHVKLNMYLWGNKKQKSKLSRFYAHDEKVREVLDNFLERTGLRGLVKSSSKDRRKIRQFLNDEAKWREISRVYAEEFSKLMQPGYALPLMNHSGSGTKGREDEDSSDEGSEFDREMRTREFKKERIQESYENREIKPVWMGSLESLDLLYESLAEKLKIKAETFTNQSKMPVYLYGSREFDPEKDDFSHIDFRMNDNAELELRKRRFNELMPLEVKIHEKGFPRTRFGIVDTSGSMSRDPDGGSDIGDTSIIPFGDNSRYHYALLSWYGFLEYLRQNHLLSQTGIGVANFGDETNLGIGLEEAKRVMLYPQLNSSTTKLELDKVKTFFEGRGNLIFTISDGEISNWDEIKDEFVKDALKHHYFHLQVGNENETTEYMRKKGLKVEEIKNAQDLAQKTIDLTDKSLRGS